MRLRIAAVVCFFVLFAGCTNSGGAVDRAVVLRNSVLESKGCQFRTMITADYGEDIYVFSMECKTDREGNLTFSVLEPASIAGITGKITGSGGAITFDGKVLAFQTMADGQITPVCAPWVFMKALRSGYLKDCMETDGGFQISIDDSYEADALRLNIQIDTENRPKAAEVFWQGRRVLVLAVEDFMYL